MGGDEGIDRRVTWLWDQPRVTHEMPAAAPVAWVPGPAASARRSLLVARGARRLIAHPVAWREARANGYRFRQLVRLTLWRESLAANGWNEIVGAESQPWLRTLAMGRKRTHPRRTELPTSDAVAVIITQNRREKLLTAIGQIQENLCPRVVVVDGGSTDGSVDAARAAGAVVIHRPFDRNFAAQRNFGARYARKELGARWIFRVDDDEEVSPDLGQAIRQVVARGANADAVYVPVVNYGPALWELDVQFVAMAYRADRRWRGRVHERLSLPAAHLHGLLHRTAHQPQDH